MTKYWTLGLMQVGSKYQLDFPNGGKSNVELVKINQNSLGNDYIFNPLTTEDRKFSKHENWEMLGWESPWWFPLPESLVYNVNPRPLDGDLNVLTDAEIHKVILMLKINTIDSISLDDIRRNISGTSEKANKLLVLTEDMGLSGDDVPFVIDAITRFQEKLIQVKQIISNER